MSRRSPGRAQSARLSIPYYRPWGGNATGGMRNPREELDFKYEHVHNCTGRNERRRTMTREWVILAGLAHFGLVAVGTQVPRVCRWKEDLAHLGPANRRLFWVYGLFIVLANIGFGALSLAYAREIAEGK